MRNYDVILIIHPEMDDTALKELLEKVKSWITDSGGTVSKVDFWGKRRMTYEVRKQREGQYVALKTQMDPSFGAVLERNLRLAEPVMRFMITSAA